MNIFEQAISFFANVMREAAQARIEQRKKNEKMFKTGVKYWDVKNTPVYPDEPPGRYQMRKWLSQVEHGCIVGNTAMLLCYDKTCPEKSYVIIEDIKS